MGLAVTAMTIAQAIAALVSEGHGRQDVQALIDSLIEAGLDAEPDPITDEWLISAADLGVLREQLGDPATPSAYQAAGGTATLIITRGGTAWEAPGTGLDESEMLRDGIRAMATGDWTPSEADGWTEIDGPFDPATFRGWEWIEVASRAR